MSDRVPEDVPPSQSEAGGLNDSVLSRGATTHKVVGTTAGEERDDNGLKMKFVWCPPGTFMMGSPKTEPDRHSDEGQVEVRLTKGFWLGKYTVTQREWEGVTGTTPWERQARVVEGPQFPATHINWEDATEFVARLTIQERQAGRLPADWRYTLPTEAQWEYACRAGTRTAYGFGSDRSNLSDYAWWGGDLGNGNAEWAHEVGLKQPNAWGLHDLHGNVFEWCRDWYQRELPGGVDPEQATEAPVRVMRGGSWLCDDARFSRSAGRAWGWLDKQFDDIGFRVVRSCEP